MIKTTFRTLGSACVLTLALAACDQQEPPTAVDGPIAALDQDGQNRTARQVDRMGIPALNTVFNHPSSAAKTAYNTASPADDIADYFDLFAAVLGAVANPNPEGTAALLLPDALPVNMGVPTTSFGTLTGRALADDAVDVALSVVIGPSLSFLHSDNVDANDAAFRTEFPYVAPAHTP